MNRIKLLRDEMKMSQEELASKLDLSNGIISMYENESRKPSYEVLIKLSEIFNCSIDYIVGTSNERNSNVLQKTNKLKQLREQHNLTQTAIAQILGLTSRAYGYYESGQRDISTESLIKLSKFYNVSTDYILNTAEIKNNKSNSNLLKIDINLTKYRPPSEAQKKQIEEFAKFILRDNKKHKYHKLKEN